MQYYSEEEEKSPLDYTKKSIYDFRMVDVDTSPTISNEERDILTGSLGSSTKYHYNEVIHKRVLTHLSKSQNENKTPLHPSITVMYLPEFIALKVCFIIMEYFVSSSFF